MIHVVGEVKDVATGDSVVVTAENYGWSATISFQGHTADDVKVGDKVAITIAPEN